MRDLFPRTSPDGDDTPLDVAQVRADEALIEAWRGGPLFDDPIEAPTRSPFAGGAPAGHDADELAAFAALRDPAVVASDAQVTALLRAWREEIDAVPLPPAPDAQVAAAVIRSAPPRRRSVRPMIAVAAAIAGLLLGSTAIGARSAGPEDTLLWPVTQLLWGDRAEQVLASIDARRGIDKADEAIEAGHPDAAEAALEHVTVVITKVTDSRESSTLKSDLNRVQAKLDASRAATTNPTASTTPTAAPGTGTGSTPVTSGSVPGAPIDTGTGDAGAPTQPGQSTQPPAESTSPPAPSDTPTTDEQPPPVDPTTPPDTPSDPTTPTTPDEGTTEPDDDGVVVTSPVRPDEGGDGGTPATSAEPQPTGAGDQQAPDDAAAAPVVDAPAADSSPAG